MKYFHVLVIDDERLCRFINGTACANVFNSPRLRLRVQEAESGHQGLEAIKRKRPDLILVDFNMGDMTGEAFALAVRKKFPHLRCPIMLVTGSEYTGTRPDLFCSIAPKDGIMSVINALQQITEDVYEKNLQVQTA